MAVKITIEIDTSIEEGEGFIVNDDGDLFDGEEYVSTIADAEGEAEARQAEYENEGIEAKIVNTAR